jgi:hypothetical protein
VNILLASLRCSCSRSGTGTASKAASHSNRQQCLRLPRVVIDIQRETMEQWKAAIVAAGLSELANASVGRGSVVRMCTVQLWMSEGLNRNVHSIPPIDLVDRSRMTNTHLIALSLTASLAIAVAVIAAGGSAAGRSCAGDRRLGEGAVREQRKKPQHTTFDQLIRCQNVR